jgi:hypothetical protein
LDRSWLISIKLAGKDAENLLARVFPQQSIDGRWTPIQQILKNVCVWFAKTPLSTRFTTHQAPRREHQKTIELLQSDVVGRIARQQWISGTVMDFLLNVIAQSRQDIFIFDPLARDITNFKPPVENVKQIKYMIRPQSISNSHWVIAIIEFEWSRNQATVHVYDPAMSSEHHDTVQATTTSFTLRVIERWLQRKYKGEEMATPEFKIMLQPVQCVKDAWSCGFLCILAVYAVLHEIVYPEATNRTGSFTQHELAIFRVKCLHLILCDAKEVKPRTTPKKNELMERVQRQMWSLVNPW